MIAGPQAGEGKTPTGSCGHKSLEAPEESRDLPGRFRKMSFSGGKVKEHEKTRKQPDIWSCEHDIDAPEHDKPPLKNTVPTP